MTDRIKAAQDTMWVTFHFDGYAWMNGMDGWSMDGWVNWRSKLNFEGFITFTPRRFIF